MTEVDWSLGQWASKLGAVMTLMELLGASGGSLEIAEPVTCLQAHSS